MLYQGIEVSVIYYRVGYAPDDYSCQEDWDLRLNLENSVAIKCPNINYHLAGTKKVQQAVSMPGMLERFLFNEAECAALRSVFAGLYRLGCSRNSH